MRLRLVTYNVRRCQGRDGKVSCDRIAEVLADLEPDVAALQELDVGRPRSDRLDQPGRIAECLRMEHVFHASMEVDGGHYGNATLSRFPLATRKAAALPGLPRGRARERRSALWVSLEAAGREVHVLNTHLGLLRGERARQVETLLGPDWLESPACSGTVILCGDLNCLPGSRIHKRLQQVLDDAQLRVPGRRPANTFSSRFPLLRLDYVFVDRSCDVRACHVPRTGLPRLASDHLPLVVDLGIPTMHGDPEGSMS